MSRAGLQADQLLDGLVGLSFGTRLQVLAQEDQRDDQGGGVIEGHAPNDLREERRDDTHHIGSHRADRDEGIHVGAAMPQRLDGTPVKFPADDGPDGCGEEQQELVLAGEVIHEEHTEDHHWQCQHDPQDEQVALACVLRLLASALLVLAEDAALWYSRGCGNSHHFAFRRRFLRRWYPRDGLISNCFHLLHHLLDACLCGVKCHRRLFCGKINTGVPHPWDFFQSFLDAYRAGGAGHPLQGQRRASLLI